MDYHSLLQLKTIPFHTFLTSLLSFFLVAECFKRLEVKCFIDCTKLCPPKNIWHHRWSVQNFHVVNKSLLPYMASPYPQFSVFKSFPNNCWLLFLSFKLPFQATAQIWYCRFWCSQLHKHVRNLDAALILAIRCSSASLEWQMWRGPNITMLIFPINELKGIKNCLQTHLKFLVKFVKCFFVGIYVHGSNQSCL